MKTYTKVINKVFETNDYSKFRKLKGNRELRKDESLKDSLNRNGQLQPIVVNKFYEVLDGQHRLASLKELGLPVAFIIDDKYEANHVVSMNNSQKGWTNEQFLNFHAENGKEEYVRLRDFYQSHGLSLNLVITGGMSRRMGTSTRVQKIFRNDTGTSYLFDNENQLHEFDIFYKRYLSELRMDNKNGLESALWTLYTTDNFDKKRMIQKSISLNVKDNLFGVTRESIYLEVLLKAHNHMLKEDSQFYIAHSRNSRNSLIIE